MLCKWPRSSLAFMSKRLLSSVKLEEFNDCRSYLKAVVEQCQLQNQPLQWPQISANLVNTLRMDETTRKLVKPQNLDYFVLSVFLELKDAHLTASYLRYLKEQGKPALPMSALIHVLKCWSKNDVQQEDIETVTKTIEEISHRKDITKEASKIICSVLANIGDIDHGVNKWKLEKHDYDVTNVTSIMKSALKQNRLDVFWQMCDIEEFLVDSIGSNVRHLERYLSEDVFIAFIEKYHDNAEEMDKLFSYFRDRVYFLSLPLIFSIQKYKKAVVVQKSNRCKNCGNYFPKPTITKADCDLLADAIETIAFTKEEVFKTSSPKEVERFRDFLLKASDKNINFVIDGLNAGFGAHIQHKNTRRDGIKGNPEHVTKALQWLKSNDYNVLVMHRTWLKKRGELYDSIADNVSALHLLNKLSDDDIFSLLAALRFGPNTLLASNDVHRQYFYKMPTPQLKRLFVHWQLQHKVKIWFSTSIRNSANITWDVSQPKKIEGENLSRTYFSVKTKQHT